MAAVLTDTNIALRSRFVKDDMAFFLSLQKEDRAARMTLSGAILSHNGFLRMSAAAMSEHPY